VTRHSARRAGWAIFALALVLRLAWIATLEDRLRWPDEEEHAAIGRRLAAGEGFVASSYRNAPVLPAYLGLAFRLFGDGYMAPRVGQAILGALTCVLVYRTGSLLVSPAVGLVSGALLAVYPPQIYLAGVFYTSCLETFLYAWCLALAARVLCGAGGIASAGLSGVILGLAVLTRPIALVLGPCVVVALCLADARRRVSALAACAMFLLGAAITVLPWSVRNQAVYGRFLLVSSGGGQTLWKGNNELADGGPDDRYLRWDRDIWRVRLEALDAGTRAAVVEKYAGVRERVVTREREVGDYHLALDDVLAPVARDYIAAEPGRAVRLALRKLTTFFSAFSRTATETLSPATAVVAAVAFYPLLLLAALGPALAPRHAAGLLLPYLVVAAMAAAHAVLTSCTRFRLPVDPYIILGASFAAVEIGRRLGAARAVPATGARLG
jgi:4-amino-4-deoxy-L-arabinose transferase-like glycosyltransferase